jgi:hypothetical protein
MLTPKEKKRLARLEKHLAMPRWKYLLLYGLPFGILAVLLTSVIDILVQGITVTEILRKRTWLNLVTIPVAGFLFAKILHWLSVKEYLKLKRKEASV